MIGVLGATGAVGSAVIRRLAGHPLRTATRAQVTEADALREFCSGCDVVVNCVGFGDRIARVALDAGAHYVDAGDGLAVSGNRVAVTGAGAMPGASGLLARYLGGSEALTVYAGGLYRFSPAAAADFVVADRSLASAAWRDGTVRYGSLPAQSEVELPFFPQPVTARPYLSVEAQIVARQMGLVEANWYTVFDGPAIQQVLRNPDPQQLIAASALDSAGRTPYLVITASMGGRTVVLRGFDGTTLTAAVLAHTAEVVATLPAGTHYAAEVLDPRSTLEPFGVFEASRIEEGAL